MYYLYSLLAAPGVIVHELSHAFFCLLAGVKIHKIKLFQFKKTAGYVVHDEASKVYQAFFITFGPLIINSLLVLFCAARITKPFLYNLYNPLYLWLGIAIGFHAIPSTSDAKALFSTINHRFGKNPLVIFYYPFVLVIYILNLLRRLHLDFVFIVFLFWLGQVYLK